MAQTAAVCVWTVKSERGWRFVRLADCCWRQMLISAVYQPPTAIAAVSLFGMWLGLRGGARVNLEDIDDDSGVVGAFGLSVALTSGVYVDAQLTRGRDEVERGWTIAGRVGF